MDGVDMKRYVTVVVALMTLFLAGFVVVETLHVTVLADPRQALGRGGVTAAIISVALLVGDVVLPVPSSGVMIANGALFGGVAGAALSLAGTVGAALVGFAIGRRGGPLLDRLMRPDERHRADALLERWGALAILVTRPVPIFAESVVVLAGASSMSWRRATFAALIGAMPAAVLYALAGAFAASLANGLLVFALVIALAAVLWVAALRSERNGTPRTATWRTE
jgi:uncharacterized membrane protein YdjX (TVP38/TMEM64 family)